MKSGDHRQATFVGFYHPSKSGEELGDDVVAVGEVMGGEDEYGSDEDGPAPFSFTSLLLFVEALEILG